MEYLYKVTITKHVSAVSKTHALEQVIRTLSEILKNHKGDFEGLIDHEIVNVHTTKTEFPYNL